MSKILVVEDDEMLNAGICFNLQKAGHEPIPANDLTSAQPFIKKQAVDLILLDVNLPDGNGFEFARKIKSYNRKPFIFITAHELDDEMIKGFELGADDYITKPFNPLELMARVKSQIRRYVSLGSMEVRENVLTTGGLTLDPDSKEVTLDGEPVRLTATEYGILELLMRNMGRVLSTNQIYEAVWNEPAFSTEKTVTVHIRRIREKIEINPKEPKYLKVVWGIGYKIEKY